MKLLIDMNLPQRWLPALSAAGHEAQHWRDVGEPTASDAELMAYARRHGFVVLTMDLDFGDILATTGGMGPSVVQIRCGGVRMDDVLDRVVLGLALTAGELALGALVSIDPLSARVRLLPLRRPE